MMRRTISSYTLLFTSVSAILGSGWLFAAYYTSKLAGPAAILSWLIGGFAVGVVAFIFAELCAMMPISGSSTRIPQYTHGSVVSFIFSWIIWLSYASLVPTEVQAVLQYVSFFFPNVVHANGGLTEIGYGLATILMLLVSAINIFSLRWLLRSNSILTVIKIFIPIVISIMVLIAFFSPHHVLLPAHTKFMPFGLHGMFAAIATGGIVYAFNGFKQACELAGEAKRPYVTLPFAIIGSIVVCLIIYLLLQGAFLSSLNVSNLGHGWANLHLYAANSPMASIIYQDHFNSLLPILYVGAIVGPFAAALMYMSSASRSLYGMSMNKQIPSIFKKLTVEGNPACSIVTTFILGMCLFAPLPGWKSMITFLTSLMAVTYAIAPICLLALRYQAPKHNRPFKLPFATVWATTAFYICTLLIYWSGWAIISKLGIAILIGFAVLLIHHYLINRSNKSPLHWRPSLWMWPYFIGITLISYLGNFGGGRGLIPFGWDFVLIAVFTIAIMMMAVKFRMPAEETAAYLLRLKHGESSPDAPTSPSVEEEEPPILEGKT